MIAGPLPNWEESFKIKLYTWTEQWRPGINQNQVSCKPMPQKQGTTILSSTTSLDTCLWCVPPGCFHSPPKPLWAWTLLIGQTWVMCLYPSGKRLRSMHSLPFTKSYKDSSNMQRGPTAGLSKVGEGNEKCLLFTHTKYMMKKKEVIILGK